MHNIVLEEMTSPSVQAAIEDGHTTVIVACGAVEQHGPHIPLFMDSEHGTALATEVARRLGNALVAPTIRVGCSKHHMGFPGTLSLKPATFEALCLDYAVSLAHHGFRHIFFIPSHGGNFAPLERMLPTLNDAVHPQARVVAFVDLHAQIELWRRVVQAAAGLGDRVGGHADIAEGSIMLALHPHLVHEAEATSGYVGELTPELLHRLFSRGTESVSPNGILGDARGMSKEIGRRCLEATAELLVRCFNDATAS